MLSLPQPSANPRTLKANAERQHLPKLSSGSYWPQADVDHTVQKQEKVDVRHEPVETDVELTQRPMPLPHPVSKYLALVIVHRVGSWISKVSVTGPIQHWR